MASEYRRAIGIFPGRLETASALQALSDSDFSMRDVSIIAKDADHQKQIAGVNVQGEMTNQADTGGAIGAATGGILGGVTGLLVGLGTLTIPGLGPALLAGEAAAVLSTVVGAAGGAAAGGLVGALIGLGIPEHRAARYQDRVAQGGYLVMLKGTEANLTKAESTLRAAGIEDWGVYPMLEPRRSDDLNSTSKSAATVPTNDGATSTSTSRGLHRSVEPEVDQRVEGRDRRVNNPAPVAQPYTEDASQVNRSSLDSRDRSVTDNDRRSNSDTYQSEDRHQPNGLPHSSNPLEPSTTATGTNTSLRQERRLIGTFVDKDQMEAALVHLQQTDFPMHTLSIVVREANGSISDKHLSYGGHSLAGATRLAAGLDRITLPEIGSVLAMGPDASVLSRAHRTAEANSHSGGLDSLGIAPESAHLYSRHLINGAYLLTLQGDNQAMMQAASTLDRWGMRDWGIYDMGNDELSQ